MNRILTTPIGGAIVLWLLSYTMFIVDQRRFAIVSSMGEIRQVIDEPGLHVKLPPFQTVSYLDKREMMFETSEADHFSTSEKSGQKLDMIVSALVKWKITDPKTNFVAMGVDEARTRDRLAQTIKAALTDEVAKRSAGDVISTDRNRIADAVRSRVAETAKQVGVDIIDLHIKHVDYLDQASAAVYERMKADRMRIASELRAQGSGDADKIHADADGKSKLIITQATRDAQVVRGEGDAKAAQIYNQAYNQSPEFYKFYRSMEAYRAGFKSRSDVMVIDPNSEFFKYMKNPEALNVKK